MPTDNGTVHQAVCIQQQQIGEIKASLQTRKEENQEIKGQISTLINMLTTSQLDQTKRDSELKSELTKIATVLGNEREQRKVYEQQQAEQRLNLEQLQKEHFPNGKLIGDSLWVYNNKNVFEAVFEDEIPF